jgi:hypothetical protein
VTHIVTANTFKGGNMYLKEDHMIPVINRLEHLKQIDKESRIIKRDEWINALLGSASAIGLIFILAQLISQ